jgi:sugar/nucleoside kinase (ribokinase family)
VKPSSPPELLVAGSVALDTRDGPFGTVEEELGGSAVYFALAASLITRVRVVAPVGPDGLDLVTAAWDSRSIDAGFLQIVDAPTYRWRAHQSAGRNIDLGSRDTIYDSWEPAVPAGFGGWAFVGSMRPDRQAQLMVMLDHAELLAADAMLSYVHSQPPAAHEVLRRADWYFCNQEEFGALGGDDPEQFRRRWSLRGLVVKGGAKGVTAYTEEGALHVPALTGRPLTDTTGAGDALAGGMLARWLTTGGAKAGLQDAIVWGVACASLTIDAIGVRGIAAATREQLAQRVKEVEEWVSRES